MNPGLPPRRRPLHSTLALGVAALMTLMMAWPRAARAEYPDRPLKVIVPFAAGAAADSAMRVVGKRMGELLGQPVVVEAKPGVPGIQSAAIAAPDGYTLLLGAGSAMVTHPLLNSHLPYDPLRDFVPVGRILINVPILTVHPGLAARSVKDLVALAKARPHQLNYSSSGMGSPNHLAMEMLEDMTGIDMVHVPYKGAAPSVSDLVAGHVQLGINAIPSVAGQIKAGKLVPLGVASSRRSRLLPEVPTISESGVTGFEYEIWYALFAPARTPAVAVSRASAALQASLKDPEVQRALLEQGAEPAPLGAPELALYMQQDISRWKRLIKERHLVLE